MRKCVFVISPLRGTPEQLREIQDEIDRRVAFAGSDATVNVLEVCAALRRVLLHSNMELAKRLCHEVARLGHAPFAPHVFYPLFLDDTIEDERNDGIECGRAIMVGFDEAWVYRKLGMSEGMIGDVSRAETFGVPSFTPPEWMP